MGRKQRDVKKERPAPRRASLSAKGRSGRRSGDLDLPLAGGNGTEGGAV